MSKINYNNIDINENQIHDNNSDEDYQSFNDYGDIDGEINVDNIDEYEKNESDVVEEIDPKEKDDENNQEGGDDDDDDDDDIEDGDDIDIDEDEEEDNMKPENVDGGRKKDIPLIIDFKLKEQTLISCINRITRPILTKYEKTLILGQRAQQISKGSNILVNIEKLKNKNPLEIARYELLKGVIPFIIRRPLPNGQYEDWKVSELKDINN